MYINKKYEMIIIFQFSLLTQVRKKSTPGSKRNLFLIKFVFFVLN